MKIKEIEIAKKYKMLTVIERIENKPGELVRFKCQCDCGKYVNVLAGEVNRTKSCGCIKIQATRKARTISLIGKKFGKLTVIEEYYIQYGKNKKKRCKCSCSCGENKLKDTWATSLTCGDIKSCGCIRLERLKLLSESRVTHGNTRNRNLSAEYKTYTSMRARCYCKSAANYKYYGGSGIVVDDLWNGKNGFENFLNYIGPKPEPKEQYSLDRIDSKGNYEPGNVKWSTRHEQATNKFNSRIHYENGKEINVSRYCKENNLNSDVIWKRLKRGVPFEEAIKKTTAPWHNRIKEKQKVLKNTFNRLKKIYYNKPGDNLTFEEWLDVLKQHNYKCVNFDVCGHSEETGYKMTLDHICPRSKGGFHTKDNVQPCCKSCNSSKGTKDKPLPMKKRNGGRGSLIKNPTTS